MPLASQVGVACRQLSLMMVTNPGGPCSSKMGSASGLGTPKLANEGPIPRRTTRLGSLPVMMNPPMPTFASVRTRIRVERLSACAAPGVGLGVTSGAVAVAVAVAVGVSVGVNVAVGVTVGVNVAVGVGDIPPQVVKTLNTMCMFGNPTAAVVVGTVIPQAVALI